VVALRGKKNPFRYSRNRNPLKKKETILISLKRLRKEGERLAL